MQCAFVDDHFLDQAQVLGHLGEGTYGTVKLIQVSSNEVYAIKYIKIDDTGMSADAMKDADALSLLRSVPEVVQLKGICQSLDQLAIIMEPMQMDLSRHIFRTSSQERLRLFEKLFFSLIRAASIFRDAGLVHYDIKPANILVSGEEFKLADFGLSGRGSDYLPPPNILTTIAYRSPEVIFDRKLGTYPRYAIDMWSIGLVLVGYVRRSLGLFSSESIQQTGQEIHKMSTLGNLPYDDFASLNQGKDVDGRVIIDLKGLIDPKYINIITNLLELNPTDRSTPDQILKYLQQSPRAHHLLIPSGMRRVDNRIPRMLELLKLLEAGQFANLMAIELYTRYLGVSQLEEHPLGYLAAVRLTCEYNFISGQSISELISTYRHLYSQEVTINEVKEAEEDLLNKLNFRIFYDDLIGASYEMQNRNIDLKMVPIEEFSKSPIQWFK